jgi:stage III sporulation protein AF
MNFIRTWISGLAVLVILLALIDLLVPEGGVKKLVNLVSGLVLVLALITPPVRFILGQGQEQFMGYIENIDFIGKSFRSQLDYSDKKLNKSILHEYRNNLENAITDIVAHGGNFKQINCDVVLNSDDSSETYGEIMRIVLDIKEVEGEVEREVEGEVEKKMAEGMEYIAGKAEGIRKILAEKLGVKMEIISIRIT